MSIEYSVKAQRYEQIKTDCWVVFYYKATQLETADALTFFGVDKKVHAATWQKKHKLSQNLGATTWQTNEDGASTLWVCAGEPKKMQAKQLKKVVQAVATAIDGREIKQLTFTMATLGKSLSEEKQLFHAVLALEEKFYCYTHTKPSKKIQRTLKQVAFHYPVSLAAAKKLQKTLKEALCFAHGIEVARELGNLPGNYCTPTIMADKAKKLGREASKITTKIYQESDLKKMKMGSFLSVSNGSDEPAALVSLTYNGGKAKQKPIVLVGKGITFDSGGISLKPGAAMDEMKYDMCGAAAVMGVMAALAKLNLPINVVGLLACAENMPSGRATKPGDVVTTMSGQTVEILNTDAEGRLVLCDTLTFAERLKPKAVVDLATLTGACVVALGQHASALYGNDDQLIEKLHKAGEATLDRAWPMPMWDDYQEQLDSNFADMANIGGRMGGSITAACFLSRFAKAFPWAHLDIAGSAWKSGSNKNATGRPVSLLLQYLIDQV